MNEKNALYKALEARGASRELSAGFTAGAMARIMMAEYRRRRRMLWWNIGGYVLASAVCIATLAYYCGGILTAMLHDMAEGLGRSYGAEGGFLWGLVIPAALLLLIDGQVRHRRQHAAGTAQNEN